MKTIDYLLILVFIGAMTLATLAMFAARKTTLGADQELLVQQYGVWVEEAERQATTTGPVSRRPPSTDIPPRVVLLRDHFGVCLTAVWVLGSGTVGTLLLLLRGVLAGKQPKIATKTETIESEAEARP